jgi:Protein of unknown function (DUF1573)/Abnormal spindle-like microcephaly-assoc'd, ASPM-SPD-2-Hydin
MTDYEASGTQSFQGVSRWNRFVSKAGGARKFLVLAAALLGTAAADAKIIYVNAAIPGANGNGRTWATAFKHLQDALDASVPGDSLYLAEGTYYPDLGKGNRIVGDRELSFTLNRVKIYGGFAGGETSLSQRDPAANPTSLSGEIWKVTPETQGYERYWSLHVVILAGGGSTLDGVTLEKGRANGDEAPFNTGGGALVPAGMTLTLNDCIVKDNYALESGGAISGTVVATNTTFSNNLVNNRHLFSSTANPIINYLFSPNGSGGAISGDVTATNCTFTNNNVNTVSLDLGTTSSATGGAISGTTIKLNRCTFDGNGVTTFAYHRGANADSSARGGAISGTVTATYCTFINNIAEATSSANESGDPTKAAGYTATALTFGGAIAGQITAGNCTFANNEILAEAASGDNAILDSHGGSTYSEQTSNMINCAFVENVTVRINGSQPTNVGPSRSSSAQGGGVHVASGASIIMNSTFLNNTSTGLGDALSCDGSVNILSNILWNTDESPSMIYVGGRARISNRLYPTPSTETVNIVRGGRASINTGGGANVDFGEPPERTLIDLEPLFVDEADAIGPDLIWRTDDDGIRLQSGSPAVGKASLQFLPADTLDLDNDGNVVELVPVDIAGFKRVQNTSLELGAYEFGNLSNFPNISIEQPLDNVLADGADVVDFSAFPNVATTFYIENTGSGDLTNLVVSVEGVHRNDFTVTQPTSDELAGGQTTAFTVTFRPRALGDRTAVLQIASNDPDESPFDITLQGNVPLPDIAVEEPVGTNLIDAVSTISYGKLQPAASATKTFTIRNTGIANLNIQSINSSGTDASNFIPSAPLQSVLIPGASTTFNVTFKPSGGGAKSATINILSNDPDNESQFSIKMAGSGTASPEIAVNQPFAADLIDGGSVSFGSVRNGQFLNKKFVIRNIGTSNLKLGSLRITGSGMFKVIQPSVKTLKPGAKTNFTVTFKPTSTGVKNATLKIGSNDIDENPFDLKLSGTGASRSAGKAASASQPLAASGGAEMDASPALGTVTVTRDEDGLKYLVLTVSKPAVGTVEVSSNLLDWYSGDKHTTTLVDNANILQVRDDTPVGGNSKRHIRLKPAGK